MSEFSKMDEAEKSKLITDIRDLLKTHNVPAEVKVVHEVVHNMQEENGEHNQTLVVRKEMPQSLKDNVDAFNREVKALTEGKQGVSVAVSCAVTAGSPYQTIEALANAETGETVSLKHNGKAWLVDFWATWCPPCQKPMAHNQEMLEKHKDDKVWQDGVEIIGISIDKDRETLNKHVSAKGWSNVIHYHRDKSNCSDVYSVKGVPHVMLVDKEGTIVFKGHPAGRPDLEDDLTKLANGEKLTGDGIAEKTVEAPGAAAPEFKPEEGFTTEHEVTKLVEQVETFKTTCSGWQKDEEVRNKCKGMMRSFCVIVLQTVYAPDGK